MQLKSARSFRSVYVVQLNGSIELHSIMHSNSAKRLELSSGVEDNALMNTNLHWTIVRLVQVMWGSLVM